MAYNRDDLYQLWNERDCLDSYNQDKVESTLDELDKHTFNNKFELYHAILQARKERYQELAIECMIEDIGPLTDDQKRTLEEDDLIIVDKI